MKRLILRFTNCRFHTNQSGEAADVLVKAALLCIVWYAGIGVYDWIQGVKQERIEQQRITDQRGYR